MKNVEKFLRRFFIRVITIFFARQSISPTQLPLHSFKRILIIRQHDQLGDLLITTPAIRSVRTRFPEAYIAVVVREYTAPMMFNNPNVNEVIIFYENLKRWNWQKWKIFWKSIRKNSFDCVIVLNTVSRSSSSDIIALLSKAPYIIGSDHLSHNPSLPEKIYNVKVPRSPEQKTEIERNLDIVKILGAEEKNFEYDLVLTEEEKKEAEKIYKELFIPENSFVVGVHFGTADVTRRFPVEKLAKVIDAMIEKYDCEIILIIGPKEENLRDELLTMIHHKEKIHNAPRMSLRVAAAFMNYFHLFLCNDTGTLHIASSQKIPTVSFHGMNAPAIWKPPHPRHIAVRADDTLITSITIEQTLEAIEKAIHEIKKSPAIAGLLHY